MFSPMNSKKGTMENIESELDNTGSIDKTRRSSAYLNIIPGTDSPGLLYQSYITMEELLEKLKLIDYERTFCRELRYKPISR
jgi:hypothetical protein